MKSSATATDREGIAFLLLTGQYLGYLPDHFAQRWVDDDVMKAIQSRYTTLGAEGDIPGLNGLFGRPRIDQAVAKLNLKQIPEDLTSTLLSYMTVKDVMNCYQCKRGGSGLLSQSLFQPQKAGGHGAEQASDMTVPGKEPRP